MQTETAKQLEENVKASASKGKIEEKTDTAKLKVIAPCAVFAVVLAGGVYTFLRKKRFLTNKNVS